MDRRYSSEDLQALYSKLSDLKNFTLPDHLGEGGYSSYQTAIRELRKKQQEVAQMALDIQQEYTRINQAYHILKKLVQAEESALIDSKALAAYPTIWSKRAKAKEIVLTKYPDVEEMQGYKEDLIGLKDAIRDVHARLKEARTDLRSLIQILQMELDTSGIKTAIKGIPPKQSKEAQWNDLKGDGVSTS